MQGKVRWFDAKKRYGFIMSDDGIEVFVAASQLEMAGIESLNVGDRLTFELGTYKGQLEAVSHRQNRAP